MGDISKRGFASMSPDQRRHYARLGGQKSGGNFAKDPARAREAGRIGSANQSLEAKRLGGRNSHLNSVVDE